MDDKKSKIGSVWRKLQNFKNQNDIIQTDPGLAPGLGWWQGGAFGPHMGNQVWGHKMKRNSKRTLWLQWRQDFNGSKHRPPIDPLYQQHRAALDAMEVMEAMEVIVAMDAMEAMVV